MSDFFILTNSHISSHLILTIFGARCCYLCLVGDDTLAGDDTLPGELAGIQIQVGLTLNIAPTNSIVEMCILTLASKLVSSVLAQRQNKRKTTLQIQSLYLNPNRTSVFERGKARLTACIREIKTEGLFKHHT